jgi:hypothetical protein
VAANSIAIIQNSAYTSIQSANLTGSSNTNNILLDFANDGSAEGVFYPRFTDPSNNVYTLTNTSALLEAGQTIASVSTDLLGVSRPKGVKYDIGAYEFNGIWSAIQPSQSTIISYIPTSNGIQVQNIEAGNLVNVYNASGVRVAREISIGENLNISLNKGIYILQTNGKAQKISVN